MKRSAQAMNVIQWEGLYGILRSQDLFADLAPRVAQTFGALELRTSYPQATTLFVEDQQASGIFVIHRGRVKLVKSPREEECPSPRIAGPGEILGIPASLAAHPYQSTAQTTEPSDIGFIDCRAFSSFLGAHGDVAFRLVQLLSAALALALDQARSTFHNTPRQIH